MMLALARQTVHGRRRTFVGTFVVLTLAVIVVTAAGVLVESGTHGDIDPDRYAGAPIVVAGRQQLASPVEGGEATRLPERARVPVTAAEQVSSVPGVDSVVPDRVVPILVDDLDRTTSSGGVRIVGQGWSSGVLWPIRTVAGGPPAAADEIAIDVVLAELGGLGLGDGLQVTSTDGTHDYSVVGLVARDEDRSSGRNLAVFFTDEVALRLTGDPRHVDALGVFVDDGIDPDAVVAELDATLEPRLVALTGPARAGPEALDVAEQNQLLVEFGGAFGSTALMLTIFVVAATLGLTVLQRVREMALLRAVGATPRQVRRMLVGEAGIVAIGAALTGAGPGLLLGATLFGVLRTEGIVAETTRLRLSALPPLVALAVGLAAALIAAWLAGRRISRLHPTSALAEAAIEPRRVGPLRLTLGVVLVSGGLALGVLASTVEGERGASAVVGVLLTLLVGTAALGPLLARTAGSVGGRFVTVGSSPVGSLARVNLQGRARRLASASTPLALSVALSITMVGSLSIEAAATERQAQLRVAADRIVSADDGLPIDLAAEFEAIPGVAAAVEVKSTTIGVVRHELFGEAVFEMRPAVGVSPSGIDRVLDLDVRAGSISGLEPGTVSISAEIASSAGVGLDDDLSVWLGDGTARTVRVRAIHARSLGFADLIVPTEAIIDHVTEPLVDHILVAFDRRTDALGTDVSLHDVTAGVPGATVTDRATFGRDLAEAASRDAAVSYLFIAVLAIFITAAMVNSLVLATGERRAEFALLRLLGATTRQVRQMVRRETLVLAVHGTLLGAIVAAATLVPFSMGIAGTPIPSVPAWFVGLVLVTAIAVTTVATELPTRVALRADPAELATQTG